MDTHGYPLAIRQQGALSERNPVCALAFRVCKDMCLEYGHIQFNLLKTIETADELFDYLIDHAWDPPSVKWCYHWLEDQLMNSPPAVMCACATVSVSIASMDYAPEPLRSLGLDFRCLIYGDATDILDNLRSAAYQESTTISAADYGLAPDEPEEETEEIVPQEPTTPTQEDMNQQNNNSTVYNGPVYNGPVFQGCTIKVETSASPFVSPESHSDHSSSNPNGYPSSSSAATNESQSQPSSVSPESNSGSSSPSPDVKTEPSPVTDNPSPVTDTPSTDLNSILDIPEPNKYTQVRKYIKDRCRFDPEFQRLFDESTRVELCSHLTNLFGWFVDPHHLGVNWNRHH